MNETSFESREFKPGDGVQEAEREKWWRRTDDEHRMGPGVPICGALAAREAPDRAAVVVLLGKNAARSPRKAPSRLTR